MGDQNTTEIFKRLSSIEQIVARIDERTKNLDERTKAHDSVHNDHERRIRELEDKEARRAGIIAALTTIGSAVGAGTALEKTREEIDAFLDAIPTEG